ncbi:tRNA (guanine(37)-N1)-methyltransferase-like [Anneissia japonica]|uniref:tRNA (guanine(37)-N1)-methyltransferase-like n=1 Tax=Anneissia japonica TaxID=1529436 RepID=UPI0014258EC1|nr:tRNA (guanine(37)-N1)-methyltransferase-like [Anneissia japonica]XP_033110445.1 tRNA (guanine(37)-N1)-methyltransferase-like [Anneissia japonica]XP_033110446.1 tRNA (guanine(37)-N1)-methyltransferase-like [Anneissia japonica]
MIVVHKWIQFVQPLVCVSTFTPAKLNVNKRLRGLGFVRGPCKTTMAHSKRGLTTSCPLTAPNLAGMTELNRDAFKKTIQVPSIKVNKKLIQQCMKVYKQRKFYRKQLSAIRDIPDDSENKFVMLDPEKIKELKCMTPEERAFIKENEVEEKIYKYELELSYWNWTYDEVIQAILPADVVVATSFSRIGHIAHMNLKPEHDKYKHIIGQVLIDKTPGITTVVNKLSEINNEFRFFKMEILTGESNMIASVKEHHCQFEFDFSKVYWNPRLATEHARITKLVDRGDVVFDIFAGVGPFAIPMAKKGGIIFANDLNPESYRWLVHNSKLNKVEKRLTTFTMDGREFIRKVVKEELVAMATKTKPEYERERNVHIVMNLPSSALEFLDAYRGLVSDVSDMVQSQLPLPTVHCHCFSKEVNAGMDVLQRTSAILKHKVDTAVVHDVRDVAPNKEMMCVTFKLPRDVLTQGIPLDYQIKNGPVGKKPRLL